MKSSARLSALVPAAALALALPLAGPAAAQDRVSPVQRDTDAPQVVGTAADTPPAGQVRDTDITRNRYRVDEDGRVLLARLRVARDGAYDARNYFAQTSVQVRTVPDGRYKLITPGEAPCRAATSTRDGHVIVARVPAWCVPSGAVDLRVVRESNLNGTTLRDRSAWLRWTVR
ncbi:hypothetical protein [Nocardioides sp. CFH 31398]|uniref:hypothetical protein n=1 Tax=Nocardioides sp. CFH 31398 TaxID=2919579 RepID=UPI001F05630F|nr:hypothetical protein [Nocardioides sp. CFH 31398]MCH1868858.1 hypothetical protein [Nocardioides sp. CFH 31398]